MARTKANLTQKPLNFLLMVWKYFLDLVCVYATLVTTCWVNVNKLQIEITILILEYLAHGSDDPIVHTVWG